MGPIPNPVWPKYISSILKNRSTNFRGSTVFRDTKNPGFRVSQLVVSLSSRFAPKICSLLVYIRSSVVSNLNCLQTASIAASTTLLPFLLRSASF